MRRARYLLPLAAVLSLSLPLYVAAESASTSPNTASKQGALSFLDLSFNLLTAAGGSTATDEELAFLQGGGHDPKRRGFTLQAGELSLTADVDPYFIFEAHVLFGDSYVELEEAFARTLSLPGGFQVEAGYMLSEFGLRNPTHPHTWLWMDAPLVNTRLLGGDGLRASGVRVGWLAPTPWFMELHLGVQNPDGVGAESFLGQGHDHGGEEAHAHSTSVDPRGLLKADEHDHEEDEATVDVFGRPLFEREVDSPREMLYLARWVNSFELNPRTTMQLGVSGLYGPNATGERGETFLYGADVKLHWTAEKAHQGKPFVAFEAEFMQRDYRADRAVDSHDGGVLPARTFTDYGFWAELRYGFARRWTTGLRYEYASARDQSSDETELRALDPERADRARISPALSFSPSHFSRLRLQYNYDFHDALSAVRLVRGDDDAHSVWLGLEVLVGKHPSHTF